MKIPYMYFEKDDLSKLILLLYRQLIAWKISVLTVYNPEIAAYILKNPSPALYKKQISREYLASKTIVAALKAANKNLQDGDGDCAFT
ncbi:MAG: hypothetical protein EOP53_21585 [Sphingobacteriales bacterium]|nr:MAG: hypothetical protein EOP53_21585 [Sphingobacteriales bacterium]